MRRYGLVMVWIGLVGTVMVSGVARAAEPADLVPHDAALYVELSDTARLVDRLLAPDITGRLDSIDQFRQFKQSDEFARLRSVVSYVETRLGTDWRQAIADLSGGGAVLAFRPGQPDYALLVLRAREPALLERTNRLLIELVENQAKENGRPSPVKSREYRGVTAWSLGKGEFHAILGDTLVVSNHQEGLKTVLEMNIGEGPPPINSTDAWQAARRRLPAGHAGWAFVRLEQLRQAGVVKELYQEKASNPAIPLFFGGLMHLLRTSPHASAALMLDDRQLGLRVELPRDGEPWPEQFQGFYAQQAGQEAAEPLRPARMIASLSFYRDLKSLWEAREHLVTPEVLPQFTELETNVGQVLFGGREFATEVLGEVGPRFRVVVAAQDYSRAGVNPQIKIPAFALVLELKHPDDFGQQLLVSFQTVMGFVNVSLGQQNQPQFIQKTEMHDGHPIHTARYLEGKASKRDQDDGHLRYNFSPSCATVGRYFVLGSTAEIVRDVIDSLGDTSALPKTTKHNVVLEADTEQLIGVLVQNKEALVSQNMVGNGNTREQAEQEVGILLELLGLLGPGKLTWTAEPESMHVDLSIQWSVISDQ